MNLRDSLLAALVATVWGFNFVVIDWGMHDVPPLLFAAVRFACVVLPAVFLVRRPPPPGARSRPSGRSCRWASSASCTSRWRPACPRVSRRWCCRPR